VTFKQHQRPAHARSGSLHLLQRLVTSLSPNPDKSSSDTTGSSRKEPLQKERHMAAHQPTNENGHVEPAQPVLRSPHRKSSGSQSDEARPRAQSSRIALGKLKQSIDSNRKRHLHLEKGHSIRRHLSSPAPGLILPGLRKTLDNLSQVPTLPRLQHPTRLRGKWSYTTKAGETPSRML
jgi:hypothetical protein